MSDNGNSRKPEGGRLLRRLQAVVKAAVDWFVGYDPVTGVLFVVGVALLLYVQARGIHYGELQAGQVAGRAYYVPYEVKLEDAEETLRLRELARRESPPVYSWNPADLAANMDRLSRFFVEGRTFLEEQGITAGQTVSLSPEARAGLWERLAYNVEQESLDFFLRWRFSADLESTLAGAYQRVMRRKVAPAPPSLDQADHILLQGPDGSETPFYELESIVEVATARAQVLEIVGQETAGPGGGGEGLAAFLDSFMTANLRPEAAETERRRAEAVDLVSPAIRLHKKGQKIAGKGEILKAKDVQLLRDIEESRPVGSKYRMAAGALVVLGLLVFFLRRYIRVHQREFKDRQSLFGMNMVVALGVALLSFALLQLAGLLADSFSSEPFSRVLPYQYGIPVAAGALLMGMLTNARMAMVSSVVMSVTFGMLAGWDLPLALYALLGSFAGIYGITQYKVRTAIIKAGLVVGGVNVVTILALAAVADQLTPLPFLLFAMGCGLVGGVLVATTASFTLPVLEWMFNVMTDIRLLELSNLNSPLLRKLAVQAPGTYNHSVIVGTLAESAAESVGVGALLCRVAAYYHDIGKMKKPEYFIENSSNATALHQKLSPTMSSLIILSHVKDGAKMARDFNLPQPIQDFILQHHGTRLITYFFKKAKKMEHREIQEVSESNFRYPGPKPQSKEAAIFMMADSVEAAARTVDDPTPAKFKDLIRKIINAVILDDQLSETDLTFHDLDKIQSSFQKTLASIYHHRIEYPGFRFEDRPGKNRATLPA